LLLFSHTVLTTTKRDHRLSVSPLSLIESG
jgi:hypothetical protein